MEDEVDGDQGRLRSIDADISSRGHGRRARSSWLALCRGLVRQLYRSPRFADSKDEHDAQVSQGVHVSACMLRPRCIHAASTPHRRRALMDHGWRRWSRMVCGRPGG
jgi:hypothetical protein